MPQKKMSEKELLNSFQEALHHDHIYACYQPQINHSTGRMVGAEALMRWKHPVFGVQYPSDFIPVLERHDLLYEADVHMFDMVCRFQRGCLKSGNAMVPISVNMSRYDIYRHEYVDEIENLRVKYDVPVKYLRIEITESSAIGGMELMKSVVSRLQHLGYVVEMDDFGSGYSSLNILKDLNVDVIKLDMNFLNGSMGGRGGIIVSSVIQMAKWLGTPVIAEGVETIEQADYMQSIGCFYIQGYLYSKPVDENEFRRQLNSLTHETMTPGGNLADQAGRFWDPQSLETVIFSNFVGPAALFSYTKGNVEILRVNKKYIQEIGVNLTEQEFIDSNPWDNHSASSRATYEAAMLRAIETGTEQTCETWRTFRNSACCPGEKVCVRSHIRVIGNAGDQYLVYALVQNITAEKKHLNEVTESERRFRYASEQANVYAWEYIIDTKEMHPCFRCMRDLHLPPVVKNYPEPAIKLGIFPPDYADMYRDWHRQLEQGVPQLEAIIPLTVGRVPFHVRYTTVFDENGRPLKAYGSATLVVQGDTEACPERLTDPGARSAPQS